MRLILCIVMPFISIAMLNVSITKPLICFIMRGVVCVIPRVGLIMLVIGFVIRLRSRMCIIQCFFSRGDARSSQFRVHIERQRKDMHGRPASLRRPSTRGGGRSGGASRIKSTRPSNGSSTRGAQQQGLKYRIRQCRDFSVVT